MVTAWVGEDNELQPEEAYPEVETDYIIIEYYYELECFFDLLRHDQCLSTAAVTIL
jgi:hypothetical protein